MKIDILRLGSYQTNCYIVRATESTCCAVIDPGSEPDRVLAYLEKEGLSLDAILLTHGHFDHVGAVRALAEKTDCRVYLCEEDELLPPEFTAGQLFYTRSYTEAETVDAAGLRFRVMHTPGHTPGSVCLIAEDAMFCGDTLFAGSCGRTDLPGGSTALLRQSLSRLKELSEDYRIFPGHAEASSLSLEKQYNPYLKGLL